jgi:hypothetical protein
MKGVTLESPNRRRISLLIAAMILGSRHRRKAGTVGLALIRAATAKQA